MKIITDGRSARLTDPEFGCGYVWMKDEDFFCRGFFDKYYYENARIRNLIFFETEEDLEKDPCSVKGKSWREASDDEMVIIRKSLCPYETEKFAYKRKNNAKGYGEYMPILDSLRHECAKVIRIDYRKCELTFLCLNCGKETTVSFFDLDKVTCSHCGAKEVHRDRWANTLLKVIKGDAPFSIYAVKKNKSIRLNPEQQPLKKKEFVFTVDDQEEKLSILCVTNKLVMKDSKFSNVMDISVGHTLNWVASYSWKEGSIARKLYGGSSTRDCDFIDLILEVSCLNNDDSLRDSRTHWYGSKNALSFISDHKVFFKKIGFFDFLEKSSDDLKYNGRYYKLNIRTESVMLKYISLLGQFPTFEQIIKAGHSILAADVINTITDTTKYGIRKTMNDWEEGLDLDTSSGVKALQIPKYVAKYLKETNAATEEYYFWMSHWNDMNLSKENFEKFVGDIEFQFLKMQNNLSLDFVALVRQGYDPHKLKRYIVKQQEGNPLYLLIDYLNMCEDSGIKPDPYPYHLEKMHDDVVDICKNIQTSYDESYVKRIQSEARDLVSKTRNKLEEKTRFPADFKEYIALFPTEKQEFFNEGNAMHSCVGPYMRNVNAGNNIVFFVRKKDDIAESYVTAEWSKKKLGVGQVLMSNNRECTDKKALAFATWVANTIQLGVDCGTIAL